MKKFFKNIEGEFLTSISTGSGMVETTQEEYEYILAVIRACPAAEEGYKYRLRTNLNWELVETSPKDSDPEISEKEVSSIIFRGTAE